MSLISKILEHSRNARVPRALDPETHEPIPYGTEPSAVVKMGAFILKTSWWDRFWLKWTGAINTAMTAWFLTRGTGEHTAAIVTGAMGLISFGYEQLASYLNSKATMKIPPRVGGQSLPQPAVPFTSDSGQSFTRSAMFKAIIAKPTSPADDEAALHEFRSSLRPLNPVPVIPKGDYAVESWDRDNGEPTVTYYETKFQAIAFRDAQRLNHVRANLL